MLKAVIMDFDGLIIDTEVVWFNIFVEWFKKNKDYDLSVEEFLLCVGSSSEDLFIKLELQNNWLIEREKFSFDTQTLFVQQCELLYPKDGVIEFIQSIKNEGLKLSLATSASKLKPLTQLKRLNLLHYFDLIVTAEDVERIKPHPDLFLKSIEKLKIDKTEALIVEDSLNGLIAGQNAGIDVLVVPNEVTKYSKFENYFEKTTSLSNVDIKELIAKYN